MSDDVQRCLERLVELLIRKKLTLSLAESCTGGKVASMMTDIPGASEFFLGSAVTYSNASKEKLLNVSHTTIIENGAVSLETAEGMAKGARELFGTDIAAAATGIAGPGGGTDLKPIGTVFIAVTNGERTDHRGLILKGSRDDIRRGTARGMICMALDMVGEM